MIATNIVDVGSAVLLLVGSALALIAAVGLHRMPDLYARMHAATKPTTLGLALCLIAAIGQVEGIATHTKLALAVVLQFLTAPTAAHLLGRAAHSAGVTKSEHTVVDEIPDDLSGPANRENG